MADAEVTFHRPAGDDGPNQGIGGILVDTPDSRAALEQHAIPRCWDWRQEHSEPGPDASRGPVPAPYCCSAYCARCAGLRALDGEAPLTPNQWMENTDG